MKRHHVTIRTFSSPTPGHIYTLALRARTPCEVTLVTLQPKRLPSSSRHRGETRYKSLVAALPKGQVTSSAKKMVGAT